MCVRATALWEPPHKSTATEETESVRVFAVDCVFSATNLTGEVAKPRGDGPPLRAEPRKALALGGACPVMIAA